MDEKRNAGKYLSDEILNSKLDAIYLDEFKGIAIKYPAYLSAYGYDVHGGGSNGIQVKIYHCPMCGRYLEDHRLQKIL